VVWFDVPSGKMETTEERELSAAVSGVLSCGRHDQTRPLTRSVLSSSTWTLLCRAARCSRREGTSGGGTPPIFDYVHTVFRSDISV